MSTLPSTSQPRTRQELYDWLQSKGVKLNSFRTYKLKDLQDLFSRYRAPQKTIIPSQRPTVVVSQPQIRIEIPDAVFQGLQEGLTQSFARMSNIISQPEIPARTQPQRQSLPNRPRLEQNNQAQNLPAQTQLTTNIQAQNLPAQNQNLLAQRRLTANIPGQNLPLQNQNLTSQTQLTANIQGQNLPVQSRFTQNISPSFQFQPGQNQSTSTQNNAPQNISNQSGPVQNTQAQNIFNQSRSQNVGFQNQFGPTPTQDISDQFENPYEEQEIFSEDDDRTENVDDEDELRVTERFKFNGDTYNLDSIVNVLQRLDQPSDFRLFEFPADLRTDPITKKYIQQIEMAKLFLEKSQSIINNQQQDSQEKKKELENLKSAITRNYLNLQTDPDFFPVLDQFDVNFFRSILDENALGESFRYKGKLYPMSQLLETLQFFKVDDWVNFEPGPNSSQIRDPLYQKSLQMNDIMREAQRIAMDDQYSTKDRKLMLENLIPEEQRIENEVDSMQTNYGVNISEAFNAADFKDFIISLIEGMKLSEFEKKAIFEEVDVIEDKLIADSEYDYEDQMDKLYGVYYGDEADKILEDMETRLRNFEKGAFRMSPSEDEEELDTPDGDFRYKGVWYPASEVGYILNSFEDYLNDWADFEPGPFSSLVKGELFQNAVQMSRLVQTAQEIAADDQRSTKERFDMLKNIQNKAKKIQDNVNLFKDDISNPIRMSFFYNIEDLVKDMKLSASEKQALLAEEDAIENELTRNPDYDYDDRIQDLYDIYYGDEAQESLEGMENRLKEFKDIESFEEEEESGNEEESEQSSKELLWTFNLTLFEFHKSLIDNAPEFEFVSTKREIYHGLNSYYGEVIVVLKPGAVEQYLHNLTLNSLYYGNLGDQSKATIDKLKLAEYNNFKDHPFRFEQDRKSDKLCSAMGKIYDEVGIKPPKPNQQTDNIDYIGKVNEDNGIITWCNLRYLVDNPLGAVNISKSDILKIYIPGMAKNGFTSSRSKKDFQFYDKDKLESIFNREGEQKIEYYAEGFSPQDFYLYVGQVNTSELKEQFPGVGVPQAVYKSRGALFDSVNKAWKNPPSEEKFQKAANDKLLWKELPFVMNINAFNELTRNYRRLMGFED